MQHRHRDGRRHVGDRPVGVGRGRGAEVHDQGPGAELRRGVDRGGRPLVGDDGDGPGGDRCRPVVVGHGEDGDERPGRRVGVRRVRRGRRRAVAEVPQVGHRAVRVTGPDRGERHREADPQFLETDEHDHDEDVSSFVFRSNKPFDPGKLEDFLSGLIQVYGQDMLRYKGVLYMKGSDRQTVFQGVHQMMGADQGRKWQAGEKPSNKMVFIGRKLPKDLFMKGLQQCLA